MRTKLTLGAELMLLPVPFSNPVNFEYNRIHRMPCKVIYINRNHGFFRVRFSFASGNSITESYKFIPPGRNSKCKICTMK